MDEIELEKRTREEVSASLSRIEVALADWENTSNKPKDLEAKVEFLKKSHMLLSDWMKKSLKGDKESAGIRLQNFSSICKELRAGL